MGFGVLYLTNNIQKLQVIKRTIFSDHLALLIERQDDLLAQLTETTNEGFSKAKEEWRRIRCYGVRIFLVLHPFLFPPSCCYYYYHCFVAVLLLFSYLDKRQEKLRTEAAGARTCTASAGPTRHPSEEMDVDSNGNQPLGVGGATGDADGGKEGKDHGQHPPAKRYRLTDTMKSIVWELVLLSNECCRLENEKK